MNRSFDQSMMREHNRSVVLNLLRFQSPISRTQISRLSGLNKATVTDLIHEILADGYAVEIGRGTSYGGRKPVLLSFQNEAGYCLGVDVGVDYVRCALTDLNAHLLTQHERPIGHDSSYTAVLTDIAELATRCLQEAPASRHGVVGIGVAVPGLVDHATGTVLHAPHLGWRDVPLASDLTARLGLPVFIDNEANAGALAEQLYGDAKETPDFVYLSVGMGIGCGIMMGGQVWRGVKGIAGEWGHMTVQLQGPDCPCGNRGCFELYASGKALLADYAGQTGSEVSLSTLRARLAGGDAQAQASVKRIAEHLGVGIVNILNGLNPSVVYIGNELGLLASSLIPVLLPLVQTRSLVSPYAAIDVRPSALGANAGCIGAASLFIERLFARHKREETP